MVNTGVTSDMGRQRKIQCLAGCLAVFGLGVWYFKIMVFAFSIGEFIAAAGIIFFAVATIHWFDDEEILEKEAKK